MAERAGWKGEAAGGTTAAGPWAGQLAARRDPDGTSATAGKDGAARTRLTYHICLQRHAEQCAALLLEPQVSRVAQHL